MKQQEDPKNAKPGNSEHIIDLLYEIGTIQVTMPEIDQFRQSHYEEVIIKLKNGKNNEAYA